MFTDNITQNMGSIEVHVVFENTCLFSEYMGPFVMPRVKQTKTLEDSNTLSIQQITEPDICNIQIDDAFHANILAL